MGYNGSGVFSRVHNWTTDATGGIKITASRFDAENDEFASALSLCLLKDGQQTAAANQSMGGFKHTTVGDSSAHAQYPSTKQVQDGVFLYAVATISGGSAMVATLTPDVSALTTGMQVNLYVSGSSNAAGSANLTLGGTTVDIKKIGAGGITALTTGDIASAHSLNMTFQGTHWQLRNPVNQQNTQFTSIDVAATASASVILFTTGSGTTLDVAGTASASVVLFTVADGSTVNANTVSASAITFTSAAGSGIAVNNAFASALIFTSAGGSVATVSILKAGGVSYPVSVGAAGQNLQSDGAGTATWETASGTIVSIQHDIDLTFTDSLTTQIVGDDSIPQNTEGDQILTITMTPADSSNRLLFECIVHYSKSAGDRDVLALFQDSTADALACSTNRVTTTGDMEQMHLRHEQAAGTASSTTFNIRIGNSGGSTTAINGITGTGRQYGGVLVTMFTITESTP